MEQEITFISKVTKEDLRAFHYNHFKKAISVKVVRSIQLLAVAFWGVTTYLSKKPFSTIDVVVPAVFVVVCVFYPSILAYLRTKVNAKNNKFINKDIPYTINEKSIHSKSDLHENTLFWQSIYKVEETKTLIVLYTDKILGIIIPKRHLTDDQTSKLRKIIEQKGYKA